MSYEDRLELVHRWCEVAWSRLLWNSRVFAPKSCIQVVLKNREQRLGYVQYPRIHVCR